MIHYDAKLLVCLNSQQGILLLFYFILQIFYHIFDVKFFNFKISLNLQVFCYKTLQ